VFGVIWTFPIRFLAVVFSGYFARLRCYLPAGQSSMCKSTPPVGRRAKPCTPAKFLAKKNEDKKGKKAASLAMRVKFRAKKGEIGIESKRSEKARVAAPHSK